MLTPALASVRQTFASTPGLDSRLRTSCVALGMAVLLLAGFYVQRSSLNLAPVVVLAFVGAICGDAIGYLIGRFGGRRLIERFGSRLFPKSRLDHVDRYFDEYGMWAVSIGRITPLIRTVNTFAAGAAKMPFQKFIVAVACAAGVWSVAMPAIGFAFSGSLEAARSALGWAGIGVFVLFAGGIAFTYRRLVKRLEVEPRDPA